jgi:hypothetical protein
MALVAVLAAACSVAPTPTPLGSGSQPGPTSPDLAAGTVSGHGMTLSVTAEPAVVAAGEPIDVVATVTNDRADPIIVGGPGSGIVFFSVTRLEDGVSSGPPVMEDDCTPHEFRPGQPVGFAFKKSGAFTDEDPDADFRRSYFADPELRLPSGAWRIDVTTAGVIGDQCRGERLSLEISLVVRVTE